VAASKGIFGRALSLPQYCKLPKKFQDIAKYMWNFSPYIKMFMFCFYSKTYRGIPTDVLRNPRVPRKPGCNIQVSNIGVTVLLPFLS
jgi:hypothetical protein